ncbi:MAG TPA: epoxyqueuosine reductase QueH [Gammaproteobacteria bacterium]|nr:epoxyqueuosine reductase QueH [Gammaproteobacteria bacterium]
MIEAMRKAGIELTIFFYNPNIHPRREYEIRKEENIRYARRHGITFFDGDYDSDAWFERVKGLEREPERGERCSRCFDLRFERSALFAHENGFRAFTSSLGFSRWKDLEQVNASGERAASRYPGLTYWTRNWRKGGGQQRGMEIAREEGFYRQEYCGCVYSLRDMRVRRAG